MASIPEAPLVLVDGSFYLFRAYHALPPLTNTKGIPTGAIYGVINMLHKLLKDYPTETIAVVFDPKGKTFREDIYPEYKANRRATPEELICQIKPLFEVIEALGLPLIVMEGYEADDVIGTLVKQAKAKGMDILISTGDKDLAQLVDAQVTLINTMTNYLMDEYGVIEKFGVKPEQMIDYLSLVGDSIDNIPGIPGVGPKTAVKWLNRYHDLNGIIANATALEGKVGEKLRDNIDKLTLSKQLVTINSELVLPYHIDELIKKPPNKNRLMALFTELEFKTWLSELSKEPVLVRRDYVTILSEEVLKEWLHKIEDCKFIALDTETTSLYSMQAKLVGISFAFEPDKAAYLPLAHDYLDVPLQIGLKRGLALVAPMLENPAVLKVGHNLKYDMTVFANHGITLQGAVYDTMIEAFLLSTGGLNDLNSLALKYLDRPTIKFEDVAGKGVKQKTFNQVDIEAATAYAAEDADICLQLHQICFPKIEANQNLNHILMNIEMPLVPILAAMEQVGVLVDAAYLHQLSQNFSDKIAELEQQAFELADIKFNLNSPKQLQDILFSRLQLPILEKTTTGQASTAESVLQELAIHYELPRIILKHRSLSKLRSTYTDSLPTKINPTTGRVHTSYHQVGTWTGRFSSNDPNLQNIPIRTEEGRSIRQAFIAPKGYKILAADYSQIELRIMAHLSKDQKLLTAFADHQDIHKVTAAEIFSVAISDVSSLQRRYAKAINFGLIYGMSAFGLAKQLGIDRHSAQVYIDKYFERYPGIKVYIEQIHRKAHELGYVETLFGRPLYLPEINSKNLSRQRAAERMAINAPMQGTAADIIKCAMINVSHVIQSYSCYIRMIMQVHDELVFEVKQNKVEEC